MFPSLGYSPAAAAERFGGQWSSVGLRQLRLVGPIARFIAKVVLDVQAGVEEERRPQRAAELTAVISALGPAVIKAGQALSSRSDLLPAEYLLELQSLQDRVPPFPNDLAFEILEAELGRPIAEVYSYIGPEPVAAASLGQVYRATLLDGTDVAVKVQRPGAEATIALDLYILRAYSRTLMQLIGLLRNAPLDLVSVIDDFGGLIYAEIDYEVEAANAARFSVSTASCPT